MTSSLCFQSSDAGVASGLADRPRDAAPRALILSNKTDQRLLGCTLTHRGSEPVHQAVHQHAVEHLSREVMAPQHMEVYPFTIESQSI